MTGDWTEFYEGEEYQRVAYLDGDAMADHMDVFFEKTIIPRSFVSVGCGPAVTELDLAARHSKTTFECYDVAPAVITDNREIAREHNLDNISFDVAELPNPELKQSADIVYCMATLYFVEEVKNAFRNLYNYVRPEGHLIANYPTEATREWVRENPEKQKFFSLVHDGQNITTQAEIESVLGTKVHDYWEAVGVTSRSNSSTVYAEK